VTIEPIERTNLTLSAGAIAVSAAVATPAFAWSVAAGALLEALNLRGLVRTARTFFSGSGFGSGTWVLLYALRFGWLAIGIGAAFYFGAEPLGLLLGLSIIVPAATLEGWRRRGPADPSAVALEPDDPEWERWNPWLARERAEEEEEDQ
jgi:hypothetical protein